MVLMLTTNKTITHADLLGNELSVGDHVAAVVEYEDLCFCQVVSFENKRVRVKVISRNYSGVHHVHSNQMVKLHPNDVTMYLLKGKDDPV